MPPTAQNRKSVKKGRTSNDDELDEWRRAKQVVKPDDQLELTDSELKEILVRQLVAFNPQVPDNLVEYNYFHGEFLPITFSSQYVKVFEIEGTQIHKESEEAKQQVLEQGLGESLLLIEEDEEEEEILLPEDEQSILTGDATSGIHVDGEEEAEGEELILGEEMEDEGEGEGGGGDAEGKGDDDEGKEDEEGEGKSEASSAQKSGKPRKLTNQFNFCERAALTYAIIMRSRETQTVPPPMASFSGNVLQWIIYDAYKKDFDQQEMEKELEKERRDREKLPGHKTIVKKSTGKSPTNEAMLKRLAECWRVLERMVNQNTYNDIAKDFRYWEDPSDDYREEEGTLLPLWKFVYDKTKKHTITDIVWNPHYYDLFAVCFGHLEFMKPMPEGAVCLFTLKNPSFPDFICMTDSPVMCADIHPKYPYMVVIGLYDGHLEVYNIDVSCKEPAFKSQNVANKHQGIVWEVKWAPDLPDGELNFFSVANDGKINNWVLLQNTLTVTTMITLTLERNEVQGPDGIALNIKGCASCIKFHPKQPLIYLVGSEEGFIYKCSTAYNSMFLLTYVAHNLPVHRIDFNKFNSDIFISCSGDWRIKIWEDNRMEPLFVFDLGSAVGDVQWAPYSSTVFAAVTNEGKAFVFDLNVNKYKPICAQAIVPKRRNKLTRIAFNPLLPILIVGDDKGCVSTLKLSPNLRIMCKAPKKQQFLDQFTLQCMKLDKLLALVREPPTLELPPDTAASDDS